MLYRIDYPLLRSLFFVCLLLSFCKVNAARDKESGAQSNIYLTDWARLKHQAELGDPDALFVLGNYYFQPPKGSSFRKNYKKSAELYFKAGIRGNASAQYNFALMLFEGVGIEKNTIESYVWFKLASNNKSIVAKHINRASTEAVMNLEQNFDIASIAQARKQIDFYTDIIDSKDYRKAKYPW